MNELIHAFTWFVLIGMAGVIAVYWLFVRNLS
jgi:hypothetical protein